MKKVLIITGFFPPKQHIACVRLQGLAKYLPAYGWQPIILTPQLPSEPDKRFRVIETQFVDAMTHYKRRLGLNPTKGFQEQVSASKLMSVDKNYFLGVVKTAKGILFYPDEYRGWYRQAVTKGSEILEQEKVDALLSSSAPVTTHLIAHKLMLTYDVPWVADLRDLWTQNHYYPYPLLRKLIEQRLEKRTLRLADALVTVSEPLAEKMGDFHGRSVNVIPNGFDPDIVSDENSLSKLFTITYTGQLYQGKRDPEILFKALRELINAGVLNPDNVLVRFFGPTQYWLETEIQKYNLKGIVKQLGTVLYQYSLQMQRESQILLLLSWNDPNEAGVYSGKIFEYLASKRPILAVGGPQGVISDLLEKTSTGVHANSLDLLISTIKKWYDDYLRFGQVSYAGDITKVDDYSHIKMAAKFASILDNIKR